MRRAKAAAFLLLSFFLAGAAGAQRLWSVGEVSRTPEGPAMVMEGSTAGPGSFGLAGMRVPAETAEVQVAFEYLRLGMGYLELPLPDGSTVAAENAVFEDRGNGNLMWTGEVPGAGYESVVLTVQDGHLVGWFGQPGGPKYVVYAGPDGRGSLAVEVGPAGDWCGVGDSPRRDLVGRAAAGSASSRPGSAASGSSDGRLDILVLYPEATEHYWRVIGGPAVGVRQLGDYLNMVFRNGAIQATANLIPVRWDPKVANHPSTQGGHYLGASLLSTHWHWEFSFSPEVATLRRRYMPDLVHFIPDVSAPRAAGLAGLRGDLRPYVLTGWSFPDPKVFAHEIGHNLGGHHDPESLGNGFEEFQKKAFRPHGFGHTDMTSCARRRGRGNILWCPATIISYGVGTFRDDDPKTYPSFEPFYSSVRHRPNGWTIGRPGTSEVERLLYETVPVAVRSGEEPWTAEQYPRKVIDAHWTGHDTVRVDWSEDWRSQESGRVNLTLAEGATDYYWWNWDGSPPVLHRESDANLRLIVRADGSQVGVEISGLRPGGSYRVAVQGQSLLSDVFHLVPPGRVSGSPVAPNNVGTTVMGPDSVRLSWRDNSSVESGFEVWYRKWSGDEPDEVWQRYGEPLPAGTRSAEIAGLAAEDTIETRILPYAPGFSKIGRYSFVVVAYNDQGFGASDTHHLEFSSSYPTATRTGKLTDCAARVTGINLGGYEVRACLETPSGARKRAWDYRLQADESGLLYFFDRDNAEILIKVLDGCAINGHRWVFVAPVTDLAFNLFIRESGPARRIWQYDSRRRSQARIRRESVGNPQGRTARTVSDTTAFRCTTAEIAAAKAASSGNANEPGFGTEALAASASPVRLNAGSTTDCEPGGPTLTLRGGYAVSMCYETYDGQAGDAKDWGLDSSQSGLMYFFERNNAEVLIKVLDGCGVNGHRWVFVAPVTDLAFNLRVESPDGEVWTHTNRSGQTADAKSDVSAFSCSA